MLIYTIITLAISIPFVWLGIRINHGALYLIHDYHQKKVKEEEKAAYGKAFSKGNVWHGRFYDPQRCCRPVWGIQIVHDRFAHRAVFWFYGFHSCAAAGSEEI